MDSKHTRHTFHKWPKVELHRHLEGSLRLATMLEISQTFGLDLPHHDPPLFRKLVQVVPSDSYSYQNFLSKFKTLRLFYRTPEIIQRLTREAILDAAADNIRHLEIRFTPAALGAIQGISPIEIIDLVLHATEAACMETQISTSLIVSMNRHEPVELAEQVVQAAADRRDDGIAGLDLAGDEANYPAAPFGDLFREARNAGLRLTVHAGEWGGSANVREALETFRADRIGHGVRVMEDPNVVALAKARGAVFEVCPTSNVQSGVCSDLKTHALRRMIDAGLNITLNTDDPGVSAIKLTHEFDAANRKMGITTDELRSTSITAAQHAFVSERARDQLVHRIIQENDQGTD